MTIAVELEGVEALRFADGSPVRAASAVAPLADGWLVAQDDATHAAWWRGGSLTRVRVFDAVAGHESFGEEAGTKHLKPDLEAACAVVVDGRPGVLLLGSGSSPRRMRAAVVTADGDVTDVVHADFSPLYAAVARALEVDAEFLNLEGACVLGSTMRWFHRGLPSAGLPTGSVDLDVDELMSSIFEHGDPGAVALEHVRHYDLGSVDGVGLAVTDAVALPGADGQVLVAAAAEDTPNPRDDGPVVGSVLAVLAGDSVVARGGLPLLEGQVCKVEGLELVEDGDRSARLLATVDADDPEAPSLALRLSVRW